jgi:amidase
LKGVRIAWFGTFGGVPFDRRIVEVVNAQRKVFEDLGCIVEDAEPDLTGAEEAFQTLRAWGYASKFGDLVQNHPALVKETVLWEVERGSKLTGADITRAVCLRTQAWHSMRRFLDQYECFILPTTQVPPFAVDQPYVAEIEGVRMHSYIDWMKSCYWISIVENPAISVPCGFTQEGLPVGLQIVGRHRDEWTILQVAYAFEQSVKSRLHGPPNL